MSSGLLLGAAASLATVSVAGAADLPLKAKAPAVQYVKICSLYGAGFYYIPGTDTCLKIGGHLRVDAVAGSSGAPNESLDYNSNWDLASTRFFNTRVRAYASFDARSQTDYGTLRSYFVTGATIDAFGGGDAGPATTPYMHRAFIQLAGFTWGLADSIFDTYSITPIHLDYVAATNGNIGATGIWQWRYTAQLGGGLSASIAVEEPRRRNQPIVAGIGGLLVIPPAGPAFLNPYFTATTPHIGGRWPDVLGQLELSGPWGSLAVAGAISNAAAVSPVNPRNEIDEIGFAASVGGMIKVPGMPGDTFGFQVSYANGATGYVTGNANNVGGLFITTKDALHSTGFVTDAVLTGPNAMELTTAWSAEVGYEHAWTQTLKTSIAGGYVSIDYDAAANATLCGVLGAFGCNADTAFWNIGSRTQWSPVPNLSLSLNVLYTHIDSASFGSVPGRGPIRLARPGDGRVLGLGEADIVTGLVRVSRNFWP
jgi:hypothetical protein